MNSPTSPNEKTQPQMNPQEEALQSLCKQLLKAKLFRGFYLERRFVQELEGYRDVISLHRTERQLEKFLLDISGRLQLFYSNISNMWVGVTNGPLIGTIFPVGSLETCIWVELDELAFGQYWFSIKSLRFRQNEIILKLKMVREVEDEITPHATPMKYRKSFDAEQEREIKPHISEISEEAKFTAKQIEFDDFIDIVRHWGSSIKYTTYEFLKQDINKENIKGLIRFVALLLFSLLSGAVVLIKYLGIFTLRFMFEFSRLTHVLTPIVLKIIDALSKIAGGFYILLAMIWRDTVGKKVGNFEPPRTGLDYNRPAYPAIKFDIEKKFREDVHKTK